MMPHISNIKRLSFSSVLLTAASPDYDKVPLNIFHNIFILIQLDDYFSPL